MDFIWVFNKSNQSYSGGIFSQLDNAEFWIKANKLNGMLTKYPLDSGVFDWAVNEGLFTISNKRQREKATNPNFIGGFTSASQEHYHYENGVRLGQHT